jgi:hypothetical protein
LIGLAVARETKVWRKPALDKVRDPVTLPQKSFAQPSECFAAEIISATKLSCRDDIL